MTTRIAIPTENGMMPSHFGHAPQFTIVDAVGGTVTTSRVVSSPPHEPGAIPTLLCDLEVTDVIAGSIGEKAIAIFEGNGIRVSAGAPSLPVTTLVEGFLKGTLEFRDNRCDH